MSDWQPIETAPRDGTKILGACRDYVKLLAYSEAIEADEHYPHRIPARWEDDGEGLVHEPTHWLPIPPLPGSDASEASGGVCERCGGDGRVEKHDYLYPCPACNGTGRAKEPNQ